MLARWERVDLLDRDHVRRAIADLRPARVFHCAGAAQVARSWKRPADTLADNALGTHYLLDAFRRSQVDCRVLIPGSATVYAASTTPINEDAPLAPTSPYGLSKLAQEQLGAQAIRIDGVQVILARAFNHVGPRQSPEYAVPSMARQLALIERGVLDPVLKVGNLEARRDFTDVRDTVRAYSLLMDRGTPGVPYNVATGVARSMRTVLEALLARCRVPVQIETDPERLRPNDTPVFVGDASRLRAATGWVPEVSFERTLDDLLDYWRSRPQTLSMPHSRR